MAMSKDDLDKLAELLECTICACNYEDPRMLICGHQFCLKCIKPLVIHNRNKNKHIIPCPLCKKETIFPKLKDIQKLPKPYIFKQIQDVVGNMQVGEGHNAANERATKSTLRKDRKHKVINALIKRTNASYLRKVLSDINATTEKGQIEELWSLKDKPDSFLWDYIHRYDFAPSCDATLNNAEARVMWKCTRLLLGLLFAPCLLLILNIVLQYVSSIVSNSVDRIIETCDFHIPNYLFWFVLTSHISTLVYLIFSTYLWFRRKYFINIPTVRERTKLTVLGLKGMALDRQNKKLIVRTSNPQSPLAVYTYAGDLQKTLAQGNKEIAQASSIDLSVDTDMKLYLVPCDDKVLQICTSGRIKKPVLESNGACFEGVTYLRKTQNYIVTRSKPSAKLCYIVCCHHTNCPIAYHCTDLELPCARCPRILFPLVSRACSVYLNKRPLFIEPVSLIADNTINEATIFINRKLGLLGHWDIIPCLFGGLVPVLYMNYFPRQPVSMIVLGHDRVVCDLYLKKVLLYKNYLYTTLIDSVQLNNETPLFIGYDSTEEMLFIGTTSGSIFIYEILQ